MPEATWLKSQLGDNIQIAGRSKVFLYDNLTHIQGVYFKVGRDWIIDGHNLADGRKVVYKYVDNAFCHPNPHIATATANWYVLLIAISFMKVIIKNQQQYSRG